MKIFFSRPISELGFSKNEHSGLVFLVFSPYSDGYSRYRHIYSPYSTLISPYKPIYSPKPKSGFLLTIIGVWPGLLSLRGLALASFVPLTRSSLIPSPDTSAVLLSMPHWFHCPTPRSSLLSRTHFTPTNQHKKACSEINHRMPFSFNLFFCSFAVVFFLVHDAHWMDSDEFPAVFRFVEDRDLFDVTDCFIIRVRVFCYCTKF